MSNAMLNQVSLPSAEQAKNLRPRFLRDIVVVPLDTGVLIDGLGRQEIIRGSLAQTVLPDLISFLDGTHTMPEIEAEFPSVPPEYLHTAVSILSEWGMIEHNVDQCGPGGSNRDSLAFLRRHIAASGFDRSVCTVYERLRAAKVLVVGSEELNSWSNNLRHLLEASGIGSVDILTREQLPAAVIPPESLIIALSLDEENEKWYRELDQQTNQFSWLRAVINTTAGRADIGPIFRASDGTCYSCFRDVHVFGKDDQPRQGSSMPYDQSTWLGFIALESMYSIGLPPLALNGRRFRRFHLPTWESRELRYPRIPGCLRCRKQPLQFAFPSRNGENKSDHFTDTALVFEEYVGLESRAILNPTARNEFAQINRTLSQEAKRLPNCLQIPLYRGNLTLDMDVFEAFQGDRKTKGSALTLDKLASLLAVTSGIREISESFVRRWAATAGNLGSVELFVVSRAIDGLNPGFFFYQPHEHTLASFRRRTALSPSEFIARVLGRPEDELPDALILFTGAFHRLAKKYGSFAYRLMNLDAGAALSQLHLVAASMSLYARQVPSRADDLIQEQLNLLTPGEQPTAVVEIARKAYKPKWREKIDGRAPIYPVSLKAACEFVNLDLQEVTAMLLLESLTKESDVSYKQQELRPDLLPQRMPSFSIIKFPKPAHKGLSVGDVLAKRRSVRKFSQRPVDLRDISTALYHAHSADTTDHVDTTPLTYFVLANNVQGIEQAVYIYEPGKHALLKVRQPLSHELTVDLLVQSEFADAPVIIWIAGSLAIACAQEGAQGHRKLLVRAGATGHRLWMVALGLGLSGSIFAGLIPGAARRMLGMDGYRMASLFAFAAGYQSDDIQSQAESESILSK